MDSEKQRVQFREALQQGAHADALRQEIAGAYYDDEISYEQCRTLVGADTAANFRVLKQQLDEEYIEGLIES